MFDVTAKDTDVVLQLPACRRKSISDGNIDVLVVRLSLEVLLPLASLTFFGAAVQRGLVVDHDLRTRNAEVDADVKSSAALVVLMRLLDDHVAAGDAAEAVLQCHDFFMDARLDGGGDRHVAEGDLGGCVHRLVKMNEAVFSDGEGGRVQAFTITNFIRPLRRILRCMASPGLLLPAVDSATFFTILRLI
jgi:hypothetical protein